MNKPFTQKLAKTSKTAIGKLLFLSWLFLSLSFYVKAQNTAIKITGTVVDSKGEQLIGVSVKVKGGTAATTSDVNGKFSITVPNARSIVVFSYLGFTTKEETVGAKIILNITLLDDTKLLKEIVVVGYGEVNRKDLTGSISSVNIADLVKAPVTSYADALAGRVAGVQVTSPDGQPGAAPTIIIRGGNSVTQDNSPLYVIDGFPIENFNNNSINPSDIESIDVLKDASSTAIYGARGANGVIIVTTKKGTVGAPKVAYKTYYGMQSNTKKMALMSPYEFVRYQLDVDSIPAEGSSSLVIYDIYSALKNPTGVKTLADYNVAGIDWQDQIFREAPIQSHDISMRGGNKDTKYSVSSSFFNQQGTLIASDFKRYQTRITLDQTLNKKFKFGLNVNYSNVVSTGSQISGQNTTSDAFLISAWRYRPVSATGDLNELLTSMQDPSLSALSATNYQWNPVFTRNNETRDRKTSLLTTNAYIDYSITPDLKLKVTGGINTSILRSEQFNNSMSRLGSTLSTLGNGGPNGSVTNTNSDNFLNENTLTYNKILAQKHSINVVLGSTIGVNKVNVNGVGATLLPNENLGVFGLGQGTPQSVVTARTQNSLASFLGRGNYNYKSKYLISASIRADGSSKFVGKNVWGYFPSGSVAWRLSEEKFLKNNKIISDAKIRSSYGVIGNNRVSDYASYALLGTGGSNSYSSNSTFLTGTFPLSLSNPLLKWETTKEVDLGVDLGFLKDRIILVADYYNKNTSDLLLSSQLPGSSGYAVAFQNIGSVQNRGFEFALTTININKKAIKWNSTFNISFNRNKILSLTSGQNSLTTITKWSGGNRIAASPSFVAKIGQPIGMFYGLVSDGVYQYSDFDATPNGLGGFTYLLKPEIPSAKITRSQIQPGYWKFKDLNGDLIVDVNDLSTIGNPNPDFIGGFSNNLSYKGFDLNVFLQYSYGNDIMNVNRILMEGGGGTSSTKGANMFATYANRWSATNPSNDYATAGAGGQAPDFYPSRIVEDGSFIRLKTVNLGYAFNSSLTKKMRLNGLRLYMSAQNLYTLTNYQGLDPEVDAFRSALTPGLDYSAYPRAKTITFGLDITL
jgi:TonB-linked SusC/RagA family outer membrane protein